jgi:hypothetical protein
MVWNRSERSSITGSEEIRQKIIRFIKLYGSATQIRDGNTQGYIVHVSDQNSHHVVPTCASYCNIVTTRSPGNED